MSTKPLTIEQAVIVSAYTGYLICDFALMHKAIEERLGPVFTHQLPDLQPQISEAFKADFIALQPKGMRA